MTDAPTLTFDVIRAELAGLTLDQLSERAVREASDFRPAAHARMSLLISAEIARRMANMAEIA
jgi:hypothetical protein